MNAKLVFFNVLILYVYSSLNVPPSPSTPLMRSEPLVRCMEIEITRLLPLTILCGCVAVYVLSRIDLNCRFVSFDTRLNTLTVSAKEMINVKLDLVLLILLYLLIFDYYLIIFLPFDFSKVNPDIRAINFF